MNKAAKFFAIAFWIFLASVRLRAAWPAKNILTLLLALQSGLAAWQLLIQKRAVKEISQWGRAAAWTSALLPLAIKVESVSLLGRVMGISGLALALWSMLALGRRFGIAPADRGLVTAGPYRLVRHPMYLGELLSVLGALIGNVSLPNGLIVGLLAASLAWRILAEERILTGYGEYKSATAWRLLPGVW
jgi:protein-S-isoprenylcysteine O-methyltransferase Ste14